MTAEPADEINDFVRNNIARYFSRADVQEKRVVKKKKTKKNGKIVFKKMQRYDVFFCIFLQKLEQDDDDEYLDSAWADGSSLKRHFQGLNNISWRPH